MVLEPFDNKRLNELCGQLDTHLEQIENHLTVSISRRGNSFLIRGNQPDTLCAKKLLEQIYAVTKNNKPLSPQSIHLMLKDESTKSTKSTSSIVTIRTKKKNIKSRSPNQANYMQNIREFDINFSIGPAGTGKTYLAVATALEALDLGSIKRLVFIRPAVEAGEKLGFLPGDLEEKVNPYLRPLYDALYDMLGVEIVEKMLHQNTIEIAPLAFMRGRTLSDAFVILDEAQNTTTEQMKMFLTRMGFGTKMVITGDITQIDLPYNVTSGLIHARDHLQNIAGLRFNTLTGKDIVRHPLVKNILEAYDNQHD